MNRNVKMSGRGLYSPRLRDVAWLEDAQFIFLIFHIFVCKFGWVDAVRGKKKYVSTNVWKIRKINRASSK